MPEIVTKLRAPQRLTQLRVDHGILGSIPDHSLGIEASLNFFNLSLRYFSQHNDPAIGRS